MDVYRCWHLPSNALITKIALHDLDLLFEGIQFEIVIYVKQVRAKMFVRDICGFRHLLTNDVIAKMILRDIELLLKVNNFQFLSL